MTPPNPYYRSSKEPSAAVGLRKAHAYCPPSIRCHKRKTLPGSSPVTACHLPRSNGEYILPVTTPLGQDCAEPKRVRTRRPCIQPAWPRVHAARQPFRRCIVPGTTRQHANETATALQQLRPAPAGSLLGPLSPSTAFRSPGLPSRAPATTPAAAEVPALVMIFIPRVTSLSGVIPRTPQPHVRPSGTAQFP